MHLGMKECPVLFSGHCALTSDLVSRNGINSGVYLLYSLVEVGISNLMY